MSDYWSQQRYDDAAHAYQVAKTRRSADLDWVLKHMPDESRKALDKMVQINPQLRGGAWDDCLSILMDSDSHLDITEPIQEIIDLQVEASLISAVAITLLYADRAFATRYTDEMRALAVAATITDNRPMCVKEGCVNRARKGELYCTRHESRETYEKYWPSVS